MGNTSDKASETPAANTDPNTTQLPDGTESVLPNATTQPGGLDEHDKKELELAKAVERELAQLPEEDHTVFRLEDSEKLPPPQALTEEQQKEQKESSTTEKVFSWLGKTIDSGVRGSFKMISTSSLFKKETKELIGELYLLLEKYCADLTVTELLVGYTILTSYYTHRHPYSHQYIDENILSEGQYYMKFSSAVYGWKLVDALIFKKVGKVTQGLAAKMTPGQQSEIAHNNECYTRLLGLPVDTLFHAEWFSHHLRPAHLIAISHEKRKIVVAIRGTMDFHDCMADVICNYEELEGGGLGHRGILWCARKKLKEIEGKIGEALQLFPEYGLVFTGHSLGAATAALMAHLYKLSHPEVSLKMFLYGCPPVLDKENSLKYINDAYSFVNGNDVIPRLTYGSIYDLKDMIQGVLVDNPTVGQKFWQIIAAGGNLPKTVHESGNKRFSPNGINLTKLKSAKKNEKIFQPGKVIYLYNPKIEHSKNYYGEYSEPFHFDEIILSVSMYADHFPTMYIRSMKLAERRMNFLKEKNEYPPIPKLLTPPPPTPTTPIEETPTTIPPTTPIEEETPTTIPPTTNNPIEVETPNPN